MNPWTFFVALKGRNVYKVAHSAIPSLLGIKPLGQEEAWLTNSC